jgi:hypothetical protein
MKSNTDSLWQQIHNSMDLKDTEELIEIWKAKENEGWTSEAIDAVEEILRDRNVDISSLDLHAQFLAIKGKTPMNINGILGDNTPLSDLIQLTQHKCLFCNQENPDNLKLDIVVAKDETLSHKSTPLYNGRRIDTWRSKYSDFTPYSILICKNCLLNWVTTKENIEFRNNLFWALPFVGLFAILYFALGYKDNLNLIIVIGATVATLLIIVAFILRRFEIKRHEKLDAQAISQKEVVCQPKTEEFRRRITVMLDFHIRNHPGVHWSSIKWWYEDEYKKEIEPKLLSQ